MSKVCKFDREPTPLDELRDTPDTCGHQELDMTCLAVFAGGQLVQSECILGRDEQPPDPQNPL